MAGPPDHPRGITRRGLLVAGAAAGAAFAGARPAVAESAPVVRRTDFTALPDASGWPAGWACPGVANLRVVGGRGVLEAGSDVFPDDPRPLAFAVDARVRDGSVRAVVSAAGSLVGVAARRVAPREYYAAFYDVRGGVVSIVRRSGADQVTLAQLPVPAPAGDVVLELEAAGASPTTLTASLTLAPNGVPLTLGASDGHPPLQQPGDLGVIGQARTLFPNSGPPVLPSLGNVHLLPYGVQEGEAFLDSPAGQQVLAEIRRESTVTFREVAIRSTETPRATPASVIAATSGLPRAHGARLHVGTDLPADVTIEVARSADLASPRRVAAGRTGPFEAFTASADDLPPGARASWRATVHRAGTATPGPVLSFPVLPAAGDGAPARVAIAACAAQFGPLFDDLAAQDPDVLVWQGDLNYPDTHGPLAQTVSGYAGIWRDFLANPRLRPVLDRSAFLAVRDDHDYAAQDSNSTTIPRFPWAIGPWDALLGADVGYRFSAGLADVWVLDQRRFKSDPEAPDGPAKTLLGERQKAWLLKGLRDSTAPFKVICSPCTVFLGGNGRDGNWSNDFRHERDELLAHLDREVSGRVLFVSGDTHLTGVYDHGGRFEARPCPLGIPTPNDITITDPQAAQNLGAKEGVVYADDRCHYALLEVRGDGTTATLELKLRREDGTTAYAKTFRQPVDTPLLRLGLGRVRSDGVHVSVTTDRPVLLRVRATLARRGGGRPVRLLERVLHLDRAGHRHVILRPGRRGRALLRRGRPGRLDLLARAKDSSGHRVVRRLARVLRR